MIAYTKCLSSDQVEKAFRKLQMAVLSKEDRNKVLELLNKLSTQYPLLPEHYPKEVYPLFVTSKQYLQMVDGTLSKPFLPRDKDKCLRESTGTFGDHSSDGMDLLAILEDPDEPNETDNFWEEGEDDQEEVDQTDKAQSSQQKTQKKIHLTYQVNLWLKNAVK